MYNTYKFTFDIVGKMGKKNIIDNTISTSESPDTRKYKNFSWKNFATRSLLLANFLIANPWYNQIQWWQVHFLQKKNAVETPVKFDSLSKNTLSSTPIDSLDYQRLLNEIIVGINSFRKENGLQELTYNFEFQAIAQEHADYCAKNNRKNWHYDKQGKNGLQERAKKHGYYGMAKENIYLGRWDPVQLRKKSPSHSLIMLDPEATEFTVWINQFEDWSFICVLVLFDM